MKAKVLCVDDEPRVLSGLRRMLAGRIALDLAEGPEEALRLVAERGPFGVVLSDMRMPGMDGTRLLEEVKRRAPETVRMMLTGDTDQQTAAMAVNRGQIFRFLSKPCSKDELIEALDAGLEQYRLQRAERELLEDTLSGAVRVLTEILSLVDPAAVGRSRELARPAAELARDIGVVSSWEVEVACLLSRLGRVTVPGEIREKELEGRRLHPEELEVVGRVPEVGWRLLQHVPRLEWVAASVRYQTARYDGAGSPKGWPRGDEIPLGARLFRAIGDFVELRRSGKSGAEAVLEMERDARAYDPEVLEALARRHRARPVETAPPEPHGIPFDDLRPGHVLGEAIETRDGRRVLSEGYVITRALLEKLRNYHGTTGIREPVVVVGRTEVEGEDQYEEPERRRTR